MQDESKTKEQLVDELNDMRLRMSEFKDSQGKVVAYEMALRESEERFRLLYQNAPLGYQSLDENGCFLEVNKAWLNILGYSREEVIGKWFGDFLAPDYQAQFKVNFGWIEAAGDNHTEFEMVRRDGSRITVALDRKIGHAQNGRFKQTYCILRNITRHKLADEALKRSEEMLKSYLAASPLGITLSAPDRKIVWANEAAYMMFGFSEQKQMTGRLINSLYGCWEESKRLDRMFLGGGAAKKAIETESKLMRADGTLFDGHIRTSAVDPSDLSKGFVSAISDISSRKRNEERLRDTEVRFNAFLSCSPIAAYMKDDQDRFVYANDKLLNQFDLLDAEEEKEVFRNQLFQSQKMEALATLVCGIAHDVNNMLQVILGAAQLLLMRKDNGDRDRSHIQYIVDMVHEGAALVKKLRLFGKQAGCQPVRMDLNHKIRELTASMCGSLPKTVRIKLELSDEPATIRADNNHVAHVVTNLVTNASEAMPNGGSINIATEIVSLDAEYCTRHHGAKPGNHVMLLVSDTGIGMDSQTMGRIFDPFFSKKEWCSIMGTGLGLSVAQAIVEQHGGHITCESELDKGTVFKAYFPAVDAPAIIET